jgi:hypothetical protein
MLLHEPDIDGGGLSAKQFELRFDVDWMEGGVQGLASASLSVVADLSALQIIPVDFNRNIMMEYDRLSVFDVPQLQLDVAGDGG